MVNSYASELDEISIHAPRVGSDLGGNRVPVNISISIHAPRVGSDFREMHEYQYLTISIHAPRVGSDFPVDSL